MIIENGKGIEVNTAGLKYGMSDPNPHHEIIKRYIELGGEIITIGSDGHCPKHMAYDFYKLPDFLSNLGIRYYVNLRGTLNQDKGAMINLLDEAIKGNVHLKSEWMRGF